MPSRATRESVKVACRFLFYLERGREGGEECETEGRSKMIARRRHGVRVTTNLGLPVASVVALPVVSSPPLPAVFSGPAQHAIHTSLAYVHYFQVIKLMQ